MQVQFSSFTSWRLDLDSFSSHSWRSTEPLSLLNSHLLQQLLASLLSCIRSYMEKKNQECGVWSFRRNLDFMHLISFQNKEKQE